MAKADKLNGWTLENAIEKNGNLNDLPYDEGGKPLYSTPTRVYDSPVLSPEQKVLWAKATIERLNSNIRGQRQSNKGNHTMHCIKSANRLLVKMGADEIRKYITERKLVEAFLKQQKALSQNSR